ncbi:TOBE domain-containing protein [Rhodovulum sp. 12E13]|nr:TOBE domain-containing protein [Rhodovulum sp. 12E13]
MRRSDAFGEYCGFKKRPYNHAGCDTYCAKAKALRLPDGQALDVGERLQGFADGTDVVAAIRPEAVRFAADGHGLRARLKFSEELGSARLHHFEVADETLPIVAADRRALEKGAVVALDAPIADLHFFDPETGTRHPA